MMQVSSVISLSSPSFNSYSNSEVAEIAARVVEDFSSDEYYDEFYFEREEDCGTEEKEKEKDVVVREERDCDVEVKVNGADDVEDDDFEFAFVTRDSELSSPISADEIFHNGQIRPVYPVFNRDLFNGEGNGSVVRISNSEKVPPAIRLPLRKLFIEERKTTMTRTSSSSSSDADDLEGIPSDTYCVWRPKEATAVEGRCKKSSSSGASNSKRWKLKNLLHRSQSDGGKDNFLILSPSNSGRKKEEKVKSTAPAIGKFKHTAAAPPTPPPYIRDGGEKRRSYLPYRQDLVGIFSNVNGFSKNIQPF